MSNEKTSCLRYIGDDISQLYGEYSIYQTIVRIKWRRFFLVFSDPNTQTTRGCRWKQQQKRGPGTPWVLSLCGFCSFITQHLRCLKWRNPHLYKLYGYGLCKENPPPKWSYKVQDSSILGSWNFWWFQFSHVLLLPDPCRSNKFDGQSVVWNAVPSKSVISLLVKEEDPAKNIQLIWYLSQDPVDPRANP